MVYSTRQMHDIAQAMAFDMGPRTLQIDGSKYVCYCLSKKELYRLFVDHGYSADRTRWINTIIKWGDINLWDELVPKEIKDPNNWSCHVIFKHVDADRMLSLKMYAENIGAQLIPRASEQVATA